MTISLIGKIEAEQRDKGLDEHGHGVEMFCTECNFVIRMGVRMYDSGFFLTPENMESMQGHECLFPVAFRIVSSESRVKP